MNEKIFIFIYKKGGYPPFQSFISSEYKEEEKTTLQITQKYINYRDLPVESDSSLFLTMAYK